MLSRFGVDGAGEQMKVENIAAVLVTAELPPYQRIGARIDVIASSIGDARSLQGGTLLPTSLRGPDGEIVALAQGPLSIGGFGGGGGGSSVSGQSPDGRPHSGRRDRRGRAGAADAQHRRRSTFALRDPDFSHGLARRAGDQRASGRAWPHAQSIPGSVDAGGAGAISADRCPSSWRGSRRCPCRPTSSRASSSTSARARSSSAATSSSARPPSRTATSRCASRRGTSVSQPAPFAGGETVVVPNQQVDVRGGHGASSSRSPEGATLEAVTSGAQRARRDAARHHRHHAGAQGGRRAPRRDRDSVGPMAIQHWHRTTRRIGRRGGRVRPPRRRRRSRNSCARWPRSSSRCCCRRCCARCARRCSTTARTPGFRAGRSPTRCSLELSLRQPRRRRGARPVA